jgi:large repetitive protein
MAFPIHSPSKAIILSVGSAGEAGATSSIRPVMTGTADANTTVTLYDGVRYLGTTVVSSSGEWSFTPAADIKNGKHQFTAISIDSQNHWGAASQPMHVSVDTTMRPPVGLVVNGLTDDTGHAIPFGGTTANPASFDRRYSAPR